MANIRDQSTETSFERVAIVCGAAVMILVSLSLAGWLTGLRRLASLSWEYIPMASSTAWSFLLLGAILLLHGSGRLKGRGRGLTSVVAILVAVFGVLNFLEYFIGLDLSFEEALFPTVQEFGQVVTNRMSPLTGAGMFLSGFNMFLLLRPRAGLRRLASVLGSLVAMNGFIGATGYLFGTPLLYDGGVVPIAANTSIAFLLLGIGLIAAAGPELFPLRLLVGSSVRARLLRVFLPLTVSIILAQGWVNQVIPRLFPNPALTVSLLAVGFAGAMVLAVTIAGRAISYDLDRARAASRQAEEELRTASSQWRTTFDAISDAVFLLDLKGNILQCNRATADLAAKPFADIIGRPCWTVIHGMGRPIDDCPVERLKQSRHRETLTLPRGDRWLHVMADPILNEAGELIGAVHLIADITQMKQAEENLRKSYRKLQRTLEGTVSALAATAESRDPYIAGHQKRVAQLACAIAREMGLPEDQIRALGISGQLHDIGKMSVPAEILSKPGKISDNGV